MSLLNYYLLNICIKINECVDNLFQINSILSASLFNQKYIRMVEFDCWLAIFFRSLPKKKPVHLVTLFYYI